LKGDEIIERNHKIKSHKDDEVLFDPLNRLKHEEKEREREREKAKK
jgi:hypothetical protein